MKIIRTLPDASPPLLQRIVRKWSSFARQMWANSVAFHAPPQNQLRLASRLAVAHGGIVSVVEFRSEAFLVATTAKGQIALLSVRSQEAPAPKAKRISRRVMRS